jgi:hypothetical protein
MITQSVFMDVNGAMYQAYNGMDSLKKWPNWRPNWLANKPPTGLFLRVGGLVSATFNPFLWII